MKTENFKTTWGTCYFLTYIQAIRYYFYTGSYKSLQEARKGVDLKLKEKSIFVGKIPELKPGEQLLINSEEGRYLIRG